MGKIITSGIKDTHVIKNRSFRQIRFDFRHENGTVNTDFVGTSLPVDLSAISLKVKLHQFGKEIVLYSGDMYPAVAYSLFGTPAFFQFESGTTTAQKYTEILAKDTSVKAIITQKAVIDLGNIYNLSGKDKLTVEMNYRSSAVDSAIGTSTVEIDVEDAIGVQSKISKIHTMQIDAGVSNVDEFLKGNINALYILNTDKKDILEASAPFETLRLTSDKLPLLKEWAHMLGDRLEIEQTKGIVDESNHNFEVFNTGIALKNVRLQLDTVPANVNVGKNWIVYRTEYTNKGLMGRAIAKSNKHALQNARGIK